MHYMVDTSPKIERIVRELIEPGAYFTINRARQFGKTTTLALLQRRLEGAYVALRLSFEGRDELFASKEALVEGLRRLFFKSFADSHPELAEVWDGSTPPDYPMEYLEERIRATCAASPLPVVVTIDEVDRATDFGVFVAFLGLLRDMYIARSTEGAPAFHSVVLAGVHDIKNLKKKIRPDSEHAYNSPWNIAADFDIDLSFSAQEIATMLGAYEADHATGMDIAAVSERLHFYTSGYPFLVSRLCKTIDEKLGDWSPEGVDEATSWLLKQKNTLFDDLVKNLEQNDGLRALLRQILLEDAAVAYNPRDPAIALGVMYGIVKSGDEGAEVSNLVFQTVILDYLVAVADRDGAVRRVAGPAAIYVKDGVLDMDAVIERYSAFMKAEYRDEDSSFIERQGRLLFLCFLKPIINGAGQYYVEPEVRKGRRMDVAVSFGGREYIVELKIWRGEAYEAAGIEQLAGYLRSRGQDTGWLVSFCDLKRSPREGGDFEAGGVTIHETIIAYRSEK
jgi:hypothetical protein